MSSSDSWIQGVNNSGMGYLFVMCGLHMEFTCYLYVSNYYIFVCTIMPLLFLSMPMSSEIHLQLL